MPKRRPVYSNDDINVAIQAARKGKGRALATMLKGCPLDDLTKAFSRIGSSYGGDFVDLSYVLSWCMGAREGRANAAMVMRKLRKQRRSEMTTP